MGCRDGGRAAQARALIGPPLLPPPPRRQARIAIAPSLALGGKGSASPPLDSLPAIESWRPGRVEAGLPTQRVAQGNGRGGGWGRVIGHYGTSPSIGDDGASKPRLLPATSVPLLDWPRRETFPWCVSAPRYVARRRKSRAPLATRVGTLSGLQLDVVSRRAPGLRASRLRASNGPSSHDVNFSPIHLLSLCNEGRQENRETMGAKGGRVSARRSREETVV